MHVLTLNLFRLLKNCMLAWYWWIDVLLWIVRLKSLLHSKTLCILKAMGQCLGLILNLLRINNLNVWYVLLNFGLIFGTTRSMIVWGLPWIYSIFLLPCSFSSEGDFGLVQLLLYGNLIFDWSDYFLNFVCLHTFRLQVFGCLLDLGSVACHAPLVNYIALMACLTARLLDLFKEFALTADLLFFYHLLFLNVWKYKINNVIKYSSIYRNCKLWPWPIFEARRDQDFIQTSSEWWQDAYHWWYARTCQRYTFEM